MKNSILGWGGFIIVALFFYFHFGILMNTKNDIHWRDRQYRIIEKIEGAHEYKGKIKEDHYIKYYYIDDPNTIWISNVSGIDYHSKSENVIYTKRTPKNEKQLSILNCLVFGFGIIGIVLMSFAISNLIIF